jgi:hypothetical protein
MDRQEYQRQNKERDTSRENRIIEESKRNRRWWQWRPAWWDIPSERFAFFVVIFTGALVCVGYWQMSTMQGQLDAMERDQRPDITLTDKVNQPYFLAVGGPLGKVGLGELIWNWEFINLGKSRAIGLKIDEFIRLEDGPFKRTYGVKGPGFSGDVSPGRTNFATISSGPILEDYANSLLKKSFGVSFLMTFEYKDLLGNKYQTAVCVSRYESGAMPFLNPEDCKEEIEK